MDLYYRFTLRDAQENRPDVKKVDFGFLYMV